MKREPKASITNQLLSLSLVELLAGFGYETFTERFA
jgi:hypothetical protein